nr:MAG TPA: hypothetical protein [Caudoviricetes sp.]
MYVIETLRMQGKDINSNAVITILLNFLSLTHPNGQGLICVRAVLENFDNL